MYIFNILHTGGEENDEAVRLVVLSGKGKEFSTKAILIVKKLGPETCKARFLSEICPLSDLGMSPESLSTCFCICKMEK